jgi:hypothetical protein
MDVDLIVPNVDPLDQRSKKRALTCFRQLGPGLPDFRGSRDQPALRIDGPESRVAG